ncbi:MAG: Dyp-type peroxidase [Thermoproteota archaeon]|nr:Dyp-type peroxidase [Thermoproteota archaeon]
MRKQIQAGIYYGKRTRFSKKKNSLNNGKLLPNSSFALLVLRASENGSAYDIGMCLRELWRIYTDLERGITKDLQNCRVPSGSLSVLIAYGPKVFTLPGAKKKIPSDMNYKQFLPAHSSRPILKGSGIKYSKKCSKNLAMDDHVVIQLISKSQLATNRAVVETWRYLHSDLEEELRHLRLTAFYTGFRRDDGRSWLGFHDEISNMKTPEEREAVIKISALDNNLKREDLWTQGGTYMAFLRTEIDIESWWRTATKLQEIIIGRDKLNGSPLVGIDKNGNPITYARSKFSYQAVPKLFSDKIINHPDYYRIRYANFGIESNLDVERSIKALNESHIGRTRHIEKISSRYAGSRRIFRQGFDFVEYNHAPEDKRVTVGLNFLSYQNDPGRLFFILTDPNWLGKVNFGGGQQNNDLLSVLSCGVFFVPCHSEPFPGSNIFL